eukprot:Tamp_33582.p1 GENE.Tamp_33582~~Tamp_33582.p1  ORF type:complete len:110 (-),score=4.38 Tamp_33582:107-436(-)
MWRRLVSQTLFSVVRRDCAQDLKSACVCHKTHRLRGRADDNRAQDLERRRRVSQTHLALQVKARLRSRPQERMRVSQDTLDLRGRTDDHRAQDLEHCEHAAHVCVTRHT